MNFLKFFLLAAMGVALGLMAGVLTWVMATGRDRALGLAHRMTQALRSTQAVKGAISPISSARPMNSPGRTKPR